MKAKSRKAITVNFARTEISAKVSGVGVRAVDVDLKTILNVIVEGDTLVGKTLV